MKKSFSPLKLDKKTIAKLNEDQLNTVKGGLASMKSFDSPSLTENTSNCEVSCNCDATQVTKVS